MLGSVQRHPSHFVSRRLSVELVGGFHQLVGLFAAYCDLAAVDGQLFQHVPLLETLDVSGGRLDRLDAVSELTRLRRLNVHMNQLTQLQLGGVDLLETVDLSYIWGRSPPSTIAFSIPNLFTPVGRPIFGAIIYASGKLPRLGATSPK